MTITIKIGDTEIRYALRQTGAPRDYDGFGTFTVVDGLPSGQSRAGQSRLVLIREEHLAWQEGRYASGLGTFAWEPEGFDQQAVEEALWNKLTGKEEG